MESGKKGFPVPSGMGIACLLAAQFVVFLEGRGLGIVSFSLQSAAVGFCSGIVLGGLLFSTWLPKRFSAPCAVALTLMSALLWTGGIFQSNAIYSYGACFWGGAVLPPLLKPPESARPAAGQPSALTPVRQEQHPAIQPKNLAGCV